MSQHTGDEFHCDTPHPNVAVCMDRYSSCNHFRPILFVVGIARRFGKSFFPGSTRLEYHQDLYVVLLFGGRLMGADSTIGLLQQEFEDIRLLQTH